MSHDKPLLFGRLGSVFAKATSGTHSDLPLEIQKLSLRNTLNNPLETSIIRSCQALENGVLPFPQLIFHTLNQRGHGGGQILGLVGIIRQIE